MKKLTYPKLYVKLVFKRVPKDMDTVTILGQVYTFVLIPKRINDVKIYKNSIKRTVAGFVDAFEKRTNRVTFPVYISRDNSVVNQILLVGRSQ